MTLLPNYPDGSITVDGNDLTVRDKLKKNTNGPITISSETPDGYKCGEKYRIFKKKEGWIPCPSTYGTRKKLDKHQYDKHIYADLPDTDLVFIEIPKGQDPIFDEDMNCYYFPRGFNTPPNYELWSINPNPKMRKTKLNHLLFDTTIAVYEATLKKKEK